MIKIAILLTGVAGLILSDPEERANLAAYITHWVSRFAHEGIPLAIVITCLMAPWFRTFLAIKDDRSPRSIGATILLAIVSNVAIGKVMLAFNM